MNAMYYVVRYEGPFAFIKPWTAVRDGVTYSQQFLTPSVLEGIEKKLFPELAFSRSRRRLGDGIIRARKREWFALGRF